MLSRHRHPIHLGLLSFTDALDAVKKYEKNDGTINGTIRLTDWIEIPADTFMILGSLPRHLAEVAPHHWDHSLDVLIQRGLATYNDRCPEGALCRFRSQHSNSCFGRYITTELARKSRYGVTVYRDPPA